MMGPLALIIVLELVLSTGILGLASHPKVFSQTKHQISNVLGIQKLAQVIDTPTAPANDVPVDSSSTPASDPSTPPDTSLPNQQSTTTEDQTTPASNQDSQNLFDNEINPTPTFTPTPQQIPEGQVSNPEAPGQPTSTPNPAENTLTQTPAVLNPDDLINSPDNINSQSISEAKKEDDQINQTFDPKEQTLALITFATDKVKDMINFTKSDDFSSTNFAASRFNDQVDQAIGNLEKLSPKDQIKLKRQLINFCTQADQILRTVELSVPQESEQDIQIARGQCQELEL